MEAVLALRELDADSIPVNFLMPFDGTPLAGHNQLSPLECLRILAMVRLACPDKELRIAGGREMHLRSLQPVALQVANSIFLGDYLTSEGQAAEADLQMIADAGYAVLGARTPGTGCCGDGDGGDGGPAPASAEDGAPSTRGDGCCSSGASTGSPALRRRGAGTAEPANA